jgi:uncharacterized protein (TIGR03790 family)
MKTFRLALCLALLAGSSPWPLQAGGGEEVVVIYNPLMPGSKAVAEHYAAARGVPANQVYGFGTTTNESITRADFADFLQRPLAERLEEAHLWKFGEVTLRGTNGVELTETRVVQCKIRYAVLCYGVPLKIEATAMADDFTAKITRPEFRRNDASVDSELAWLPMEKTKIPLTGPLPNPFCGCTNPAQMNCTNGILLVTRLDGPTPDIAMSLVDKALAAERDGLWGRAYIDARGLPASDTNYLLGDQWMFASAELCRALGLETEVDTNAATFPAAFPMSHIAIYAGWYAGDVCGPLAAPAVEFMPGAFAYHLHSFSAATLRSRDQNWCGPLLARGATCTMGCVNEPYLQFTPNVAFFLQALGNGYDFGEAAWAAQLGLSWQTTVIGDPLYQPFKKSPPELHAQLARAKSPLLEWSFDRLVCLDLAHGVRAPQLAQFLENVPLTAHSPVLTEKLGHLYAAAGKPATALQAWQAALALKPTPQQRLRLRLTLGEKFAAQDKLVEARADYQALLKEQPDYAGRKFVADKIQSLEQKFNASKTP